ncbi:MAG: PKD domain-containing protein [Propionibacteriaceae bacterium]|nr:PKD domain-containing protein [Propionibacteriaceae bacterium]
MFVIQFGGVMTKSLRARALVLLATIVVALPLAIAAPSGVARADVPSGFTIVDYPTGQSGPLTDFAFTPDNRGYFSLGKNGQVRWTSMDGRISRELAKLDVVTIQDLGAVSIDLGHNYGLPGGSNSLWIVRIRPDGRPGRCPEDRACGQNVLAEFPVSHDAAGNPVSLGAERRVLAFDNRDITHAMDSVVVDKDGSIWLSIGDGASFREMDPAAFDAQRTESPYGRVVHIDRTGAGVSSNPGYNRSAPTSWASRTYAKGFRNPFRMRLHPALGLPILGDVGWNRTEEHNIVRPGGNYGWPCFEGERPTPEYSTRLAECRGVTTLPPIFEYSRDAGMGSSAMGGIIYTGSTDGSSGYPSSYVGTYFFADYTAGKIYTMRFNETATGLLSRPDARGWANNAGTDASRRVGVPVSLKYAANGDVAYSDFASGNIRRITYASSNRVPVASAEYRTNPGANEVVFTLTASDPDHDPLTYAWTFGDGTTSTEPNPTKRYAAPGTYPVRVIVRDARGGSVTVDLQVNTRNATPTLSLTTPPSKTFAVGERISLSAAANDAEDGGLASRVQWTTRLETCRGEVCESTAGPTATGGAFSASYAVVGSGDYTNWHVTAKVTDAAGASRSQTYVARPALRGLTVTNNAGAPVAVNGAQGGVRQIAVGAPVSLVAPRSADGMTFMRWSDGSDLSSRTITMPNSDLALQAIYDSRISQRYHSDAGLRAMLGAPIGPETALAGIGRQQVYERGHLYYSEAAGVHGVFGAILSKYLAEGGAPRLGVPTSDEIDAPGGAGRMNTFAGTPAAPAPAIYWKSGTGAHVVFGDIHVQYGAMGRTTGVHGYPLTSELPTLGGRGRYNIFENGGIYWSPATGARSVYGAIVIAWGRYRWEHGHLGLPTTSELGTPDGRGRFNHFQGGSIYWHPSTDAQVVQGAIRHKWSQLGWERSFLGYPTSDEHVTPDRRGSYNHFQGGSIYWHPATGAHEVHGLIRDEWGRRGWERSALGYPTGDEHAVPGGRRSNFQRGYIEWVNGRINVVVR